MHADREQCNHFYIGVFRYFDLFCPSESMSKSGVCAMHAAYHTMHACMVCMGCGHGKLTMIRQIADGEI